MKILFVGDMWVGSNARSMAEGFNDLGHELRAVDTTAWTLPAKLGRDWWSKRRQGTISASSNSSFERQLSEAQQGWRPDLLFAFKTVAFQQEPMLKSRAQLKVHYSPDDVSNPENLSDEYMHNEDQWDLVVTTKAHNVQELIARGARRVAHVWSAYDPRLHNGVPAKSGRPYSFVFIGAARPDRRELPTVLGDVPDGRSLIAGPRWRRYYPLGARGVQLAGHVNGPDFSRVAGQAFCGPVLLNSANRDTHTCRSFEIPACGLLVLAERTHEHQELYDEGTECLMFSSNEEFKSRLEEVVRGGAVYEGVARAGQQRIVSTGNTYADRAQRILMELGAS